MTKLPDNARFTSREQAREYLTAEVARQLRQLADPNDFCTYDRNWLLAYQRRLLRWLNCAPEGANHLVAPLQGRYGVPCGERGSYDVGPSEGMRRVLERKHGRPWQAAMAERHAARVAA